MLYLLLFFTIIGGVITVILKNFCEKKYALISLAATVLVGVLFAIELFTEKVSGAYEWYSDCLGTATIGTSETPSAGLATIVSEESFICVVSDKHTEERTKGLRPIGENYYEYGTETYYYVTAVREDDTALRFRTNEKFYNLCELGKEFLITEQVIDYPVGGIETRYCYKGEILSGATLIRKSDYIVPDLSEYEQDYGFAEFVSVNSNFYHIVGFDEVEYHYMSGRYPATEMQYYIIAEDADGNRLRFETDYGFWECSSTGDALTIVAQKMDYPLGGVQTNYYLNGSQLVNAKMKYARTATETTTE